MEYSLVIIIRGQCCIKYLSMINKWLKLRNSFHVGMSDIGTKRVRTLAIRTINTIKRDRTVYLAKVDGILRLFLIYSHTTSAPLLHQGLA